jgi:putative hydrolase of the HAD superfamily
MQEGTLATLELNQYFPVRAISGDAVVGVRKPHADIFHHALVQLDTSPSNALMVGDNYSADIVGAQHLGIAGLHIIPAERAQLREKLWDFLQTT